MGSIHKFYPKDAAKNPDLVLEQALGEYDKVLILGYNTSDELEARASTNFTHSDMLWVLEWFKHNILLNYEIQDIDDGDS